MPINLSKGQKVILSKGIPEAISIWMLQHSW